MSHELKEIKLSSGNKLQFALAPFADARALYQVLSREVRGVEFNAKDIDGLTVNAGKDLIFSLLGSEEVTEKIMNCCSKCLYGEGKDKEKINDDLFEGAEAREDYLEIMFIVASENIKPFTKGLLQKYAGLVAKAKSMILKGQA